MNINKYLLVSTVCLLIITAFLVGRIQTKSAQPQVESAQTTLQTATPTPAVTNKPAVQKAAPAKPTPTPERKKVSITLNDGGGFTKGTFYCYEDKVNELSNLQNDIRIYQIDADSCNFAEQSKAKDCSSSCSTQPDIAACVDNCYANALPACSDKNTKVGDLRKELYNKVQQYCP